LNHISKAVIEFHMRLSGTKKKRTNQYCKMACKLRLPSSCRDNQHNFLPQPRASYL